MSNRSPSGVLRFVDKAFAKRRTSAGADGFEREEAAAPSAISAELSLLVLYLFAKDRPNSDLLEESAGADLGLGKPSCWR